MIPVCEAVVVPSTPSAPCGNDLPAAEASGSRVLSASSSSLPVTSVCSMDRDSAGSMNRDSVHQ